jgi:hypothetical protein
MEMWFKIHNFSNLALVVHIRQMLNPDVTVMFFCYNMQLFTKFRYFIMLVFVLTYGIVVKKRQRLQLERLLVVFNELASKFDLQLSVWSMYLAHVVYLLVFVLTSSLGNILQTPGAVNMKIDGIA